MNWRISYSGLGRCFVVKPWNRSRYHKKNVDHVPAKRTRPFKVARKKETTPEMARFIQAAETTWQMDFQELLQVRKFRWALAAVARKEGKLSFTDIARAFGTTSWSVAGYAKNAAKAATEVSQLRKNL